jgi:thiol-disulfide isomerase/thioredoxin
VNCLSLFCLSIIVGSFSWLQGPHDKPPPIHVGGKSYVRVEIQNVNDTVKVYSVYSPILTATKEVFTEEYKIFSDSTCLLTLNTSVAASYHLNVGKDLTIPVFLVPDDTLTVKVDYRDGKQIAQVFYVGLYSQINRYLYDKPENIATSIKAAMLFNDPFRLDTPERTVMLYRHISDSILEVQQQYLGARIAMYKLPSWFVEFEKNENALFASYHQLMIVSYWRQFFAVNVTMPEDYFESVKSTIDITDPNRLFSQMYALYVANLMMFKTSLTDSLNAKRTNAADDVRHFKDVSEKADALLSDELFYPFLTNYFFLTITTTAVDREKLLEYLKTKLTGTAYLPFVLNNYAELSSLLPAGKPAPGFYLLSSGQNKYLALDDFKGKVILFNFWFPGCKPCIFEIPHEKALLKKYGDKGFTLINICMEASVESWQAAIRKYDLAGINVVTQGNWEAKLKEAYGVGAFPHYVLIDHEGKIVQNQTYKPSDPRLGELIEATLKK